MAIKKICYAIVAELEIETNEGVKYFIVGCIFYKIKDIKSGKV
jgi:hypothetical protein